MSERMPDLLSLVLVLRPLKAKLEDKPLPDWWGRAAHQLLLSIVRQKNDMLSAQLHEANAARPFTASNLLGRIRGGKLDLEATYRLRLTAFRGDVASLLYTETQADGLLSKGQQVELDYLPFLIEDVFAENGSDGWAGLDLYQELSAPYLLSHVKPPRTITLRFASPVSFKQSNAERIHVPIPLPTYVFGSLLSKWNTFAPITFPAEVKRYADECLAISKFELKSRMLPTKSRGRRMGGVGIISYATVNYDRYWMSIIATLANFAFYAGVGGGASQGMGQVRPLGQVRLKPGVLLDQNVQFRTS